MCHVGQVTGLRKAFQQLRVVTTGDPKEADADDAFAQQLGQVGVGNVQRKDLFSLFKLEYEFILSDF